MSEARLWATWAKAPQLRGSDVLIVAACLPFINRRLYEELARGKVVLLACPEQEPNAFYGKIASMIRSTRPRSITVVSIEGSPHCALLHASVNEAEYILNEKIERRHYVVLNAEELREISPDAVRVARYLHLVQRLIDKNPEILRELEKYSLEYNAAKKLSSK